MPDTVFYLTGGFACLYSNNSELCWGTHFCYLQTCWYCQGLNWVGRTHAVLIWVQFSLLQRQEPSARLPGWPSWIAPMLSPLTTRNYLLKLSGFVLRFRRSPQIHTHDQLETNSSGGAQKVSALTCMGSPPFPSSELCIVCLHCDGLTPRAATFCRWGPSCCSSQDRLPEPEMLKCCCVPYSPLSYAQI